MQCLIGTDTVIAPLVATDGPPLPDDALVSVATVVQAAKLRLGVSRHVREGDDPCPVSTSVVSGAEPSAGLP